MTMTSTKTRLSKSTYPKNLTEFDGVRISMPVYVGVNQELSKKILECLRNKCDAGFENRPGSFVAVQDNTQSTTQTELEQRLKIDLKTLRMVLFSSMTTGLHLDLALRIQKECGDEVSFISPSAVEGAFKSAIAHYEFFADVTNAKTNQR